MKYTTTWRQYVKLDRIDICNIFRGGSDVIPYLATVRKSYMAEFTSLPRNCPIEPGKYYATNVSMGDTYGNQMNEAMTSTPLPNGIYRHVIRIHNDDDPVGFVLYWHIEVNIRMNEETF